MIQYFPKPYISFGGNINVKVNLSNFALKSNLASFKTELGKSDIDQVKPAHVDLSKLSDEVKNDVAKKSEYNKWVAKVNNIDTGGFVLKTKCNRQYRQIRFRKEY